MDNISGTTTERPVVPPVLYLPCQAAPTTDRALVEMRQLDDGCVTLMAYTALDRLAYCCGPNQPWVLYRTEALDELKQSSHFDIVAFDQPLPENLRHPEDDG